MADLNVTRFIIDGKTFAIPSAGAAQAGLMSAEDFKKLSGVAAGAQVNVIESVKINGVALEVASKIVDILITSGTKNGTVKVNGVDVEVKGLATLAYKSQITETELAEALKQVINAKAEQSEVDTLNEKIDVLNGAGEGSVNKAVTDAINKFATDVTDDGVVNSFKELVDWAASHGSEASEIVASVEELKSNKVDKMVGYGLSKNDFTDDLKDKLNGIAAKATANTYSYDEGTQTLTLTGFTVAQ